MPQVIHSLHAPLPVVLWRIVADAVLEARLHFARWRQARRAFDELRSLDDHLLRDLGLHRSELSSLAANPDDPHRMPVMRSTCVGWWPR